jgi:superfamily II DNA or RNA helicase
MGSLQPGHVLTGSLFNEPMRVETVASNGPDSWIIGLVGTQSERFRKVTLSAADLKSLTILDTTKSYNGDGYLLRLGLQAYTLGIAYEFDPYFGLTISRVDPLPHQLEAVYDYLLKLARVRFLLVDDAGAGKTIMAGLLIRELKLRGLAERILTACPSNLPFQWQRELKDKFDEKFLVIKGSNIRDQFGVNQWLEQSQVLTSLDLAKREDILPGLRQVHWDLVIVDEAHRMSWTPPSRKTARYGLGELLRDTADHFLLLTATPHKGDPNNFSLFLQLLDADAYADVRSIREAINRRRAPFYLRRTKEAMVYFPERQPDGSWKARKIFTKRIPHTVDFQIDGAEFDLYRDVTRFVKMQSAKSAPQEEDPRARAVGFLMSLYQRRLASSTYTLRHSLENRARRLDEALKSAQQLARLAPVDLPDPEEMEEMDESERERIEEMLDAMTLAGNREQVQEEIAELLKFAVQAKLVEDSGAEAKLSRLRDLLHQEGFFDQSDKRLLIVTEFKDTLDYLVGILKNWGFRVGFIHGGMKPGSREEPNSRLYAEQQFKDGTIQVLVATEAAGEGINLQCCHILFNYDIPWNPNRLEQRMSRIHRYGQLFDCLIFNFVATNAIEGRVLQRLLEKLQEIRDALDDDAVFNVVGELLPAAHVERVLRDFYAGRLGEADMEDRLLREVDEGRFRSICQNALEGLASKKLNLEMLIERRVCAQERRLVPETIARFLSETAEQTSLSLKAVASLAHTFDPGRTPTVLKRYGSQPDRKLSPLVTRYPRLSTDRETAEKNNLEWVTPGHPLLNEVREERVSEINRIADHINLSLTELLQKVDEEIGKAAAEVEKKITGLPVAGDEDRRRQTGAEGRLAQAENHHAELMARREKRRKELEQQRALTLQSVERMTSILVLPHPERSQPEVRRLQPDPEVENIAMQVAMEHETARGCQVYDIHEKNLGYDITSLDLNSGELRLIEVKGIGAATGTVLLTPNERRVAEDRRDHYYLSVDALTQPMRVGELDEPHGSSPR